MNDLSGLNHRPRAAVARRMSNQNHSDRPFTIHDILANGKNVLIRTVTNYFIGTVNDVDVSWVTLKPSAWVADSGRLSEALKTGRLAEYEELPDGNMVMMPAVVDVIPWMHEIPRGSK